MVGLDLSGLNVSDEAQPVRLFLAGTDIPLQARIWIIILPSMYVMI